MRISDWSSDVCSSDLREIDFLTVGGASTRNVDAAAADIILGPGAALTIGFGHGVRDIFLVDLFLGDAGFGGAGRRELLGHLILDDVLGAGPVEPDQLHLGLTVAEIGRAPFMVRAFLLVAILVVAVSIKMYIRTYP